MSKNKKKKKKDKKKQLIKRDKGIYSELEEKAWYLTEQLADGLILEEVAVLRGVLFSDLTEEINANPRLVQAVKDGRAAGLAKWVTELKKLIFDPKTSATAIKLWYGNYMNWWSTPIPEEFEENTSVTINVSVRKPTKKEKKGMKKAKELQNA